ncbi:MsnO8 family LLM class oxidoreductase [Nocardia sp. NPDC004085]
METSRTMDGACRSELDKRGILPRKGPSTMKHQHKVHISVLDTAPITQLSNARMALRNSIELAQLADDLGYHRYWVPEHHGMPGVASAAPAVVAERIASVTQRIRVGAGGVMLPNHAPIVIAEQFGTLEAFHLGRIDLGLGRALGGPRDIADRVRSEQERTATPFDDQVRELLALFEADNDGGRAAAVPAVGNRPEIWMLGSGAHTARIAGSLGLPFVAAHHLQPLNTVAAVRTYLRTFQPSSLVALLSRAPRDSRVERELACAFAASDTDTPSCPAQVAAVG